MKSPFRKKEYQAQYSNTLVHLVFFFFQNRRYLDFDHRLRQCNKQKMQKLRWLSADSCEESKNWIQENEIRKFQTQRMN